MKEHPIRFFSVITALLLGLGVAEQVWLPSVDEVLKGAKSEIRSEDLPSWLDGLERRESMAPRSVESGSAAPTPLNPIADLTEGSSPPPPAASPSMAPDPRPKHRWWWYLLKASVPALFRAGDNRSFEPFTASATQSALTTEAHAIALVKNDPVLPAGGEMTFRQPILSVPGPGFDFVFQLQYRSGIGYDGPVGQRWEHNWNARIKDSASGGSITRLADGRQDIYAETSSGSHLFTSPAGQFEAKIQRLTSGSDKIIERRLQDGTLETYKKPGNTGDWYFLDSIKHRDADLSINLTYDATNGNRLAKITDTRGKEYKFLYTAQGRINYIEDWSGAGSSSSRRWELSYNSGGDLTKITLPSTGSTREILFAYSSSKLTDVTAPREAAVSGSSYLSMTYDGSNRVTSQRFGATGSNYSLAHDTSMKTMLEVDREGTSRIYYYDANYAVTKLTVKNGASMEDTLYGWDSTSALLTKLTFPEGNGVRYEYTQGRLTTMARCTAAGLTGTISRTSNDYLVSSYTYQSATNWTMVTKVTDPLGSEWAMGRDSLGNVTSYATPEHHDSPWTLTYDSMSRLVTSLDPEGRVTTYAYGATGTLATVSQNPASLNLQTTYVRDIYENVVTVTNPEGESTIYTRNALGYVTQMVTPKGHDTDYTYDLNDLVVEVLSDNDNADMPNSRHKLKIEYNLLDITTKVVEYYAASHSQSRVWTYGYDKEDRLVLTTLPVSTRQVKVIYDARGLEVTRTSAFGTADAKDVIFAYDKNHRMTVSKDGLLNTTTVFYDQFDRATKVTDPLGHYRTTTLDKNGNTIAVQAFTSGNTKLTETTFAYDDDNLLTKKEEWALRADLSSKLDPTVGTDTVVSNFTYDTSGLLVTKFDPCGCSGSSTLIQEYDAASRLITMRDHALTFRVRHTLDKVGRVATVSSDEIDGGTTRTYVVEHDYDDDGHLFATREKGGGSDTALSTAYLVDAKGRVKKSTDPNGNEVYFRRDDFGRVTEIDRMLTVSTKIETRTVYDLNDNVVQRILERGATDGVIAYSYDAADRLILSEDEGAAHDEIYVYDDADNVSLFYDRNGSAVTFLYDAANQLTRKTATLATGIVGPTEVKFYYDALGRVISAFNADAKIERTYNTLSKLEKEKSWVAPFSEASPGVTPLDVDYVYNAQGQLAETEYPDDATWVKRLYDASGRVTKIQKKRAGDSYADLAAWGFQGPSRMKTLEWNNKTKETMLYDVYGRPTTMTHERQTGSSTWATMYDYHRGYDAGSRPVFERRDYRKSSDASLLGGQKDYGDLYAYDAVDRLTKVVRGVGYQTASHSAVASASPTTLDFVHRAEYTLDEGGNRQTLLLWDSNGTTSKQIEREDHTFDIENQLGTRKEWFYDSGTSGLTLRNTITYTYDKNGTQTSSAGGGIGTVSVDLENRIYQYGDWYYRYDPFGRRVEKHESARNEYWRRFYYDGVTCIQEYVVCPGHGDVEDCSHIDPVWTRVYGPYLVDQILWGEYDSDTNRGTTNSLLYFHLDFLGSVVMLTNDTTGYPSIQESYRYLEYGTFSIFDGEGASRSTSSFDNPKLYTGRRWDPELSSYYYRARYFSPARGVFQAQDPIAEWVPFSNFAYVHDQPTNLTDPFGTQPFSEGVEAAASRFLSETSRRSILASRKVASEKFYESYGLQLEAAVTSFYAGTSNWENCVRNCLVYVYSSVCLGRRGEDPFAIAFNGCRFWAHTTCFKKCSDYVNSQENAEERTSERPTESPDLEPGGPARGGIPKDKKSTDFDPPIPPNWPPAWHVRASKVNIALDPPPSPPWVPDPTVAHGYIWKTIESPKEDCGK